MSPSDCAHELASLAAADGTSGTLAAELTRTGRPMYLPTGNKDRGIPIEPSLEAVLDGYLESRTERHGGDSLEDLSSPLFVHYDGARLKRGRIQYVARPARYVRLRGDQVRHRRRRAPRHPRSRLARHHKPLSRRQTPNDSEKQSQPTPHSALSDKSTELRPRASRSGSVSPTATMTCNRWPHGTTGIQRRSRKQSPNPGGLSRL